MIEFFKLVVLSQPLILIAIACVVLSAFVTLFWGRDPESPRILYIFPNHRYDKWPYLVCTVLLSSAFIIWVTLTIVNHTTIANDLLSLLTVTCFSVVLIYAAQIIFIVFMLSFIAIVMGIWWAVNNWIIRD